MKKLLMMFALSGMLVACNNNDTKSGNKDKEVITLEDQDTPTQTIKTSPCLIEVPYTEYVVKNYDRPQKWYNFCDSTVVISAYSGGNGGPIFSKRSITDLHGTEKAEMQAAYAKYQQSLGIK